jgi:hypothetical protein
MNECGKIGTVRTGRGNRSTRRKPAPVSLLPLQTQYGLARDRTQDNALRSRRLSACAMALPMFLLSAQFKNIYSLSSCFKRQFKALNRGSLLGPKKYGVLKNPENLLYYNFTTIKNCVVVF